MQVLIVTGKLAAEYIQRQTEKLEHHVDVLALPVTVASFITPKYAAKQLKKHDLSKYDMIILPGSIYGDLTPIEESTGIPTYKGPLHAADLSIILSEDIQLSKTVSASDLFQDKLRERAFQEIDEAESHWGDILSSKGGLLIGNLPVSIGLPMRIMGEIVNAPQLDLGEIVQQAEYFESQGAHIIDIGMLASNPKPGRIPKIINVLRDAIDLPLSIDTLNVEEIKTSIDSGIDLILSVDAGNMEQVTPMVSDETVVALPTNMSKGYLPKTAEERVQALNQTISNLREQGIEKIIGDLVVEPLLKPGLIEGLKAYQKFNQEHPKIPLLFGIGNAVELIDADSPGIHAVLTALAREAGASILHVPEYSVKARGSVSEAVRASQMMFLAERRGTVPKDLGLDLLLLKEKRWKEYLYDSSVENEAKVLDGLGETVYCPDKTGWFKIQVDRKEEKIVAIYYPNGSQKPGTVIKGNNARVVYQTIIRENLISKHDHAAYLGKELEKAYIGLKLGRSYVQDEPLF
ncbi:dihydropteroate synthase-like protein [Thermoproteota archaeon]